MSTRGAIGFRIHGVDKVAYNHCDSYPSYLGAQVAHLIQHVTNEALTETAERVVLVTEDGDPNASDSWYWKLREFQGDLTAYVLGKITHMLDAHDFLADSLFCEWAYIVNIDTGHLEVYKGFNTDPHAPGRYAALRDRNYQGVALIGSWSFESFRRPGFSPSAWAAHIEDMDAEDEGDA